MNLKYKIILIILLIAFSFNLKAQNLPNKDFILQIKKDSKFREKIFNKDSVNLIVTYSFSSTTFDMKEYSAKLFGDRSYLVINLPDSIISKSLYFKISSPGKVACTDCNGLSDFEELYSSTYKPFKFDFNSNPEGATLYLIPLYDCLKYFKTTEFAKINIAQNDLSKLENFKISTQQTPLSYMVVSQPYIAVFVLNDIKNSDIKITKEIIRPHNTNPELNKVISNFR
jgi:hypothetical protein